jgi:hypothetical protein
VRAGALEEQRCAPTRCPALAHQRCHQKAALVDENEERTYSPGFFLMRGQSRLTQV